MERLVIKAVGLVFQGLCQVLIDATMRAEQAEARAQHLERAMAERAQQQPANVSPLPGATGRRPIVAESEAGG